MFKLRLFLGYIWIKQSEDMTICALSNHFSDGLYALVLLHDCKVVDIDVI